jgi:peptidoglycan/LPS O-acetylase OafA/YrhL
MERTPPQKLPALTALRFFAAALIVLWHSQGTFGLRLGCYGRFDLSQAVSFFFVLSGFILAHAYPDLKGWGARGRFLLARFARLWPAHALALATVAALNYPYATLPAHGLGWKRLALLNLAMLHSWVPAQNAYYSWNCVSWSISTEFAFYFFFLLLIPNWRKTWHVKLALSFGVVCGLFVLARAWKLPFMGDPAGSVDQFWLVYIFPPARLFEFTLGMAAYLLWQRLEPRLRLGRTAATAVELAAVGVAVVGMGCSTPLAEWISRLIRSDASRRWLQQGGVCALPFALLIVVMAGGRGWLGRLLSTRPLVLLGEASYSLYLFHQLPVRWYSGRLACFDELPRGALYVGYWALLLVGSHLVWAAVERPCRSFLVGLWPKPGGRRAGEANAAARGLWGRLEAPGLRLLGLEAALVAAVVAFLGWSAWRGPAVYVGPRQAQAVADRSPPELRGVCFADRLQLLGAQFGRAPSGELRLKLAWMSLQDHPPEMSVTVQLLNHAGGVLSRSDFLQKDHEATAWGGVRWQSKALFPWYTLGGAEWASVSVWCPRGPLPIDRGPRDPAGVSLLLPVPQ